MSPPFQNNHSSDSIDLLISPRIKRNPHSHIILILERNLIIIILGASKNIIRIIRRNLEPKGYSKVSKLS
jgi:hypothetical protein